MTGINTINIKVTGTDLRMETVGGGGVNWANWTEALSIANWNTNTELTALQYCNPQDSSSVSLGVPDIADVVNDKTANAYNVDFDSTARLVNLITTNGVLASVSPGYNASICSQIAGNSWSNPWILALAFDISRLPTATETLYCHGSSSTDVFQSINITTSGYLQWTYKDDSGNTLTKTATTAIPFDRKMLLIAFMERSKIRIFLHGDTFDHAIQITDEGAFNTNSTLTTQSINCKYSNGATTQLRTSGYYYGHVIAKGVVTKSYNVIEQSCNLLGIPFALTDLSTLDNSLISVIQGPGAGNLATPKADVVDLIAGTVFTASGTLPAAETGKFHNAIQTTGFSSSIFLKATVPAAWDFFNNSNDFTVYIRYKTGTLDTSNRTIISLGSSTTQLWKIGHVNGPIVFVVDNSIKATSTVTLASDTWYSIILKRSGGTTTLQINGETPVTASAPGTRSVVGLSFTLGGAWASSTTSQFLCRGLIDCIAAWSKALSNDEIFQLRKGEDGLDGMFNYLTQYDGPGGSTVLEYRGTQLGANTRNNVYMCGNAFSGSGATYLSFKAPRSGRLRGFSVYWKSGTGYSLGTLGTYTFSVRNDNAGVPGATVIAERTGVGSLEGVAIKDYTFTTTGLVVAGTQYHLCIVNTDASPNLNYISINASDLYPTGNKAIVMPTRNNNTDWAIRLGYGKGQGQLYNSYTTYKGALNVSFHLDKDDNGVVDHYFGHCNAGQYSGNNRAVSTAFGGTTFVRQILPIESGDNFTITGINVALTKVGSPGDVTAKILSSNGTTVLFSTTISESNYPAQTLSDTSQLSWGRGAVASSGYAGLPITGGNTYYLQLSASGTSYYPVAILDAANYGSAASHQGLVGGWYATTGKAQISTNSGSTWSDYMGGNKDLGFYFDVQV